MKRVRPSIAQGLRFHGLLCVLIPACSFIGISFIAATGCTKYRDDLDYNHPVENVWFDPATSSEISLFQGVQWEPATSIEFWDALEGQSLAPQRTVLDLFCGPGVIALLCVRAEAKSVLAVAEDEVAAACARYNVAASQADKTVTVRDLELHSSPVLPATSKFELITAVLSEPTANASEKQSPDVGVPRPLTLARKIEILTESIDENLTPSGLALVACGSEKVERALEASCHAAGHTISRVSTADVLMPVFEIKPLRPRPSSPAKAPLPAKSPDSEEEP